MLSCMVERVRWHQLLSVLLLSLHCFVCACADPDSFVRGGPNFILVNEGREDSNTMGHHRPARETPLVFLWRTDDGPILDVCSVALWFFRGFGPLLRKNTTSL